MNNKANKSTRANRTPWVIGIAVLAVAAVTYFSLFYPPAPEDETAGTIGAAQKYRSEQIADEDVQLAGQAVAEDAAAMIVTQTTTDGRTVEGKMVDGKFVEGKKVEGKFVEGKTIEGKFVEGKTIEGKFVEGKTIEGKTLEGKTLEGKTLEGKTLEGKTLEGKTLEGKISEPK